MKYARCDNAGENEDFKSECKQEGMDAQSEHTKQGTQQQMADINQKLILYLTGYAQYSQ